MRFKNSYAAAVAAAVSAVVFSAAFQPAEASFIFYAEQVGPNVVITGTGQFNTVTLGTSSAQFPFATGPSAGDNTLSTGTADQKMFYFSATVSGSSNLSALPAVISANSSSGLGIQVGTTANPMLGLGPNYVSNTPFSNSATFNGKNMGTDFGWPTNGTWASPVTVGTWGLNNGETFSIVAVPEPTHMVSVAAVGAMYGAWRLRKLRRSREAAGDATAG
jgi:hypothetical protein